MRKHIKTRLILLSEDIIKMHNEIFKINDIEKRIYYFDICKESVISISNFIKNEKKDYTDKIQILEDYCEIIFELSNKSSINKNDIKSINSLINKIITFLKSLPVLKEVVFLPYKASMWDSFETIWEAFLEKDGYYCSVVSVPYKEFQKETNFWKNCYDGNKYPDNVEIIDYMNFNIEEIKPEYAFIHNPYDEFNLTTRVDETYYSYNLKKYVKTLVYTPYYAPNYKLGKHHKQLASYNNIDYLILNSQSMKDDFINSNIRNKILPLGSPKFDRVIKVCNQGGVMPEEWKEKAEGKKLIMLNTSIGEILNHQEALLNKLQTVFNDLKGNNDIIVVWRPHPLLGAAIKSMKPHLRDLFNKTINLFINSKIGILDETPDITNSIALCHAYMGDARGSIPNLFMITGKPIFIFNYSNNFLIENDSNRRINLRNMVEINNEYYGVSDMHGGLFHINENLNRITYKGVIENSNNAIGNHMFIVNYKNNIYLSPTNGDDFIKYNTINETFEIIGINKNKEQYKEILFFNNKIIYLPWLGYTITIYDIDTGIWSYNKTCLKEIFKEKIIDGIATVCSHTVYENKIYMCFQYSNVIIEFNPETEEHLYHNIGNNELSFTAMNIDKDNLYLLDKKGLILICNLKSKMVQAISLCEDFKIWENTNTLLTELKSHAFIDIVSVGNYFILIPYFSNSLVKINKETLETTLLLPKVLEEGFYDRNILINNKFPLCTMGKALDNKHLLVQINRTGRFVKINIENESFEFIDLKLKNNEFNEFIKKINGKTYGFRKQKVGFRFLKIENKYNSIIEYIDDISTGKLDSNRDIQLEIASKIAENLDGTCGKKVCEFLIKNEKNK